METLGSGSHGLIDIGVHLHGLWDMIDPTYASKWGAVGIPNVSASILFNYAYIPIVGMDAKLYFTNRASLDAVVAEWKGDKPLPLVYNDVADVQNYGSAWDYLLRRDLSDKKFAFQHGVKHLSATGKLVSKHPLFYTEVKQSQFANSSEFYWYYSSLPDVGGYTWVKRATSLSSGIPSGFHAIDRPGIIIGQPLDVVIESMNRPKKIHETFCTIPYVGGWHPTVPVDDYKVRGASYGSGWYYGDRIWSAGNSSVEFANIVWKYGYAARYMRYTLNFWLEPKFGSEGSFVHGAPLFTAHMSVKGKTWLLGQNTPSAYLQNGPDGLRYWYIADEITHDRSKVIDPYIFPLSATYGHGDDAVARSPIAVKTIRNRHQQISNRAPDIRPSALLSFSDALSKSRATDVNYLEVAAEGKELFELFPSLVGIAKTFLSRKPGAIKSASGVAHVNKALDSAYKLGDLLSDSMLLYSFGLKPTLQNADDIVHTSQSVGNKLRALQAPETLHGKYSRTFNHDLGPMSLVTRTTARVNGVSDDFVIKLLELEALGLSPRLSNWWDLVPWSWFIDYFTNLSKRFDAFDAYLLGNIRGVQWNVHSYTLYDMAQADLEAHGYQPGLLTIKHYFREVSRLTPGLFGGRYDFLDARGPNAGITAAILWQAFS